MYLWSMSNVNEIWRPVKGYEGLYEVSNLGRVKSLKWDKERILKPNKNRCGYPMICLTHKYQKISKLIHRLVAEAFIPNPDNKPCIDHIDTDKTNNTVVLNEDGSVNYEKTNLRWCTQKENLNNPLTVEKYRNSYQSSTATKKIMKPVIQLSRQGKPLRYFESATEAKRGTKINNIQTVCKGRINTAGNFRWLYFEDYEQFY